MQLVQYSRTTWSSSAQRTIMKRSFSRAINFAKGATASTESVITARFSSVPLCRNKERFAQDCAEVTSESTRCTQPVVAWQENQQAHVGLRGSHRSSEAQYSRPGPRSSPLSDIMNRSPVRVKACWTRKGVTKCTCSVCCST